MPWRVRQIFTPALLQAITDEVAQAETLHSAQIRVAIEGHLDFPDLLRGLTPWARARAVFAQLGVWDTAGNNGVLIYLLLAERHVEIVADRGAHACIGSARWEALCAQMQHALSRGEFAVGMISGIRALGAELAQHFPPVAGGNELPDRPSLL